MTKHEKNGFTLAEVLITLGIIGIIAALTLPNLIANHREQVTINKLKKFYSVMSQAYWRIVEKQGSTYSNWELGETLPEQAESMANYFKEYLLVSKDCGFEAGCFIDANYKLANGGLSINFLKGPIRYMIILNDGSAIAFYKNVIYYDTNGTTQPNQFGRDIFQINISDRYGIHASTADGQSSTADKTPLEKCLIHGYNCASWVLTYGNLDYLHCPEKLEWGKVTKCK